MNNNKWIKVEDKLPEEGELVLLYIPTCPNRIGYLSCFPGQTHPSFNWAGASHWMPLPPPPKEEPEIYYTAEGRKLVREIIDIAINEAIEDSKFLLKNIPVPETTEEEYLEYEQEFLNGSGETFESLGQYIKEGVDKGYSIEYQKKVTKELILQIYKS